MEKDCSEGLKKGAWIEEEDRLLRNCIESFGEGKWHLVPLRAGLNRCRKSCRLRWLNYLRPNIKKGPFSRDEVDLLKRLHKLLGNRWSLIAGRIPGRTPNDVKNFWNTHISKISIRRCNNTTTKTNLVRPRPRSFSKLDTQVCQSVKETMDKSQIEGGDTDKKIESFSDHQVSQQSDYRGLVPTLFPEVVDSDNDLIGWWSSLLETDKFEEFGNEFFPQFDEGAETISHSTMLENDHKNYRGEFVGDDVEIWGF